MSKKKGMFLKNAGEPIFVGAVGGYSFRKIVPTWSNAVFKVRRGSDDAETYVYFKNGGNSINLNSYTNASSDSDVGASTTTLGDFLTTDDGFVSSWYFQTTDDIIDTSAIAVQATFANQPKIATTGVILTKNGRQRLAFVSGQWLTASAFSELDNGNDFTIITVSYSDSTSNAQGTFSNGTTSYLAGLNDRRSNKFAGFVIADTNAVPLYLSQQDNANQRFQMYFVDGSEKEITNYLADTVQTSAETWTGTYDNDDFSLGKWANTGKLNGSIQEFVLYTTDKTGDVTDLNNEVTDYYSIP